MNTILSQVVDAAAVRHHLRASVRQVADNQIVTGLRIMRHAAVLSGAVTQEEIGGPDVPCPYCGEGDDT